MTLPKAIEILEAYLRGDEPDYSPDLPDSIKLGIEALKREEIRRRFAIPPKVNWLPGETKE